MTTTELKAPEIDRDKILSRLQVNDKLRINVELPDPGSEASRTIESLMLFSRTVRSEDGLAEFEEMHGVVANAIFADLRYHGFVLNGKQSDDVAEVVDFKTVSPLRYDTCSPGFPPNFIEPSGSEWVEDETVTVKRREWLNAKHEMFFSLLGDVELTYFVVVKDYPVNWGNDDPRWVWKCSRYKDSLKTACEGKVLIHTKELK